MRVNPINLQQQSPNFQANLWLCKTAGEVIKPNEKTFIKAANRCDEWLRTIKKDLPGTLTIRKNTALNPRLVFKEIEYRTTYAYPYEECGHSDPYWVDRYEDLEFEYENRRCGFWFNPKSDESKLLEDFKNVFNHLTKGK